jgi:hypothetical protein
MPKYYFKLVDTTIVSDYGVHELPDETAAQIEALELARSLRESRPELLGRHCYFRHRRVRQRRLHHPA